MPVFATRSIAVFTEWFIPTSSRRSRTSGALAAWAPARHGAVVASESAMVSERRVGIDGMIGVTAERWPRT
jgi:hypothetical protein